VSDANLPVIVAGYQVSKKDGLHSAESLLRESARATVARLGRHAKEINTVAVVGILSKHSAAPASSLANYLGIDAKACFTTTIGGNTPQYLVNKLARAIASGEDIVALIGGAEAMRSAREIRHLKAAGEPFEAPPIPEDLPPDPQEGDPRPGVSQEEVDAGLITPVNIYPLFENSFWSTRGINDFAEQRARVAKIFERFTRVAAHNPHAWFPIARSAEELATPSPDNRLVSEPYTKLLCAFLGGDQAASFVVCSLEFARRAGLEEEALFPVAGADLNDVWHFSQREDPSSSPAMHRLAQELQKSRPEAFEALVLIDLYSCFPVAVEFAASALGLDPAEGPELTVTGGLPYFGGPGNNYVSHALVTMGEKLAGREAFGLVTGLGWYMTKHSWGIYSGRPPKEGFLYLDLSEAQEQIDANCRQVARHVEQATRARMVTHTVSYLDEGTVNAAPGILELPDGTRVVAACGERDLQGLAGQNLTGQEVEVSGAPPRWYLR
jgi:acetyl-CoA C-acetyltransferase